MQKVRTLVAIPAELLRGVDEVVRRGRVVGRNEFLAVAIRHELERIQCEAIDREFEAMAEDEVYQGESRQISSENEMAAWEALRVAEIDP